MTEHERRHVAQCVEKGAHPRARARAGRAEWSRIWSVRSSWAFAALIGLAVVGFGVIAGLDVANSPGAADGGESAWDVAAFTAMFALFGTVAWAVVTGTADHGTGAIVPTLQWTPRRGVLLAARSTVIALTMTVIGLALVTSPSGAVRALASEFELPLDEGLRRLGDLVVVMRSPTTWPRVPGPPCRTRPLTTTSRCCSPWARRGTVGDPSRRP